MGQLAAEAGRRGRLAQAVERLRLEVQLRAGGGTQPHQFAGQGYVMREGVVEAGRRERLA